MEEDKNSIKFAYYFRKTKPIEGCPSLGNKHLQNVSVVNQLTWLKKMIEYIDVSSVYELRYDLKKGEIYEVDFGIGINSEFSNRHYAVVLVDSKPFNPLVLVCPLKTNHTGGHRRSDVNIGIVEDLSKERETLAVVNQIRTIDKFRIQRKNLIGLKRPECSIYEDSEETLEEESTPNVLRLTKAQLEMILLKYVSFLVKNGDEEDGKNISR